MWQNAIHFKRLTFSKLCKLMTNVFLEFMIMMAKFNVGLMDNCMPVLILRSRDMIGIDSCLTKSPNHQLSKIIIKTVVRANFSSQILTWFCTILLMNGAIWRTFLMKTLCLIRLSNISNTHFFANEGWWSTTAGC